MLIQEVIEVIERFAPLHWQADFDNSGLTCGDPRRELSSVLLCIDITEEVVTEAIGLGANLIISHHPLLFRGLKQVTPATGVERSLILAIKHDIVLYAAHTNIDVVDRGVSGRMADKLQLLHREILYPGEGAGPPRGYGIVGELDAPVESRLFLARLKEIFHCPSLRHTSLHVPFIRQVAVCGGAGSSFIHAAIAHEADIYISGDFKYHDFFLAENRVIIADIGHYESEQFTKDIFYELLTEKIAKFAVRFSEINTNPINYL
ncbi:MAG: Nif3-like dinuclear metal center hexameric protein [Odoribacteraceae bacterium]|nr:Nif3-like dinuclear metal center hexameric protein [Odoribacteraceae bacterium]